MEKQCPGCLMQIPAESAICPCCGKRFVSRVSAVDVATTIRYLYAIMAALATGWLFGQALGWLVLIGACFVLSIMKKPTHKPLVAIYERTVDNDELRRRAERDKIQKEIHLAIKDHAAAVKVMMALCRIDGTTSEAERRIVFAFLNRHGTELTEERHWPFFHGHTIGEWQHGATPDEIDQLCAPLEPAPQNYRIAVAAAAQAIVASGGQPKKSEQIALEIVQRII
jgi:hypothetical protein